MGVKEKSVYPQIKTLLSIPEDEPIFIVRGQDRLAVSVIAFYQAQAALERCSTEFVDGVIEEVDRFIEWQVRNQDKVKVPD